MPLPWLLLDSLLLFRSCLFDPILDRCCFCLLCPCSPSKHTHPTRAHHLEKSASNIKLSRSLLFLPSLPQFRLLLLHNAAARIPHNHSPFFFSIALSPLTLLGLPCSNTISPCSLSVLRFPSLLVRPSSSSLFYVSSVPFCSSNNSTRKLIDCVPFVCVLAAAVRLPPPASLVSLQQTQPLFFFDLLPVEISAPTSALPPPLVLQRPAILSFP